MRYRHMSHNPLVEKRAFACADIIIKELVRNHKMTRSVVVAEAADGIHGNDKAHTKRFECIDISTLRYCGWCENVSLSMSRKEGNPLAAQSADDNFGARFAKRGIECNAAFIRDFGNIV